MQGRRSGLPLLAVVVVWSPVAGSVHAQLPALEGPPAPYVPVRPITQAERDHRASLHHYVLGLLCEREDRLLEALKAFEGAARLDPTAAAILKAQVPLLLALERAADAATTARKTLDLNPGDYDVWHLYARLLKDMNKLAEARDALRRGLAVPAVREQLDVWQQMTFDLAVVHEATEEYAAAGDAYTEAAKILDHPDAFLDRGNLTRERILERVAEIHERAGRMYTRARDYDKALVAYRVAQKRAPEMAGRLNYHLAQIFQDKKQLAEALRHIEAYLRLQPQGAEAYEMKIALLRELNRSAEILPWLEQAAKADGYNVGVKLLLARQLAEARQGDAAEKLFLQLATDQPSPELYAGLFRLYRDDPERGAVKALTTLDRALDEARQRPPIPGRAAQAKAMIAALRQHRDLAKALIQAGGRASTRVALHADTHLLLAALADLHNEPIEAEQLFRRALKDVTRENELLVYGGLLRLLWKTNKMDEIIQLCRDGTAKVQSANQVLLYSDLAKALARKGKADEALEAADRALALANAADRLALRCLRVRLFIFAEQYARAEAECFALLKLHSQPGEALEIRYLLSGVYSAARNLPKAEEQLELVLKVDPNNATACNDLGYIWADQNKNLSQAEELIRKAIDLDRQLRRGPPGPGAERTKDNAAYVDSLGWVLYRRGRVEEARQELERAAALPDGDDPTIWDHLGDVYRHLGMHRQARTAWERARHLYEHEHRRRMDDRYRELLRKLKAVEQVGPR